MPFFSPLPRHPKNMASMAIPLPVVLRLETQWKGMVILMRKVNLLRRDIARDSSLQELFTELSDTRFALSQAYAYFDRVTEPELVDASIFEIRAAQARYNYLLRVIKERGGVSACKTYTEGVTSWV